MPFLLGLLGVGKWIGGIIRAIPWQVWAGLAACIGVWIAYGKAADAIQRGQESAYARGVADTDDKWKTQQATAERLQATKNAGTVKAQGQITYEVDNEHAQARDAILARSDALRLSWERNAADRRRRAPGGNGLPSTAEAACLAHAEGYDGLSWSVAHPLLTTAQLQQQQMNDLIGWVERQGAVAP